MPFAVLTESIAGLRIETLLVRRKQLRPTLYSQLRTFGRHLMPGPESIHKRWKILTEFIAEPHIQDAFCSTRTGFFLG